MERGQSVGHQSCLGWNLGLLVSVHALAWRCNRPAAGGGASFRQSKKMEAGPGFHRTWWSRRENPAAPAQNRKMSDAVTVAF